MTPALLDLRPAMLVCKIHSLVSENKGEGAEGREGAAPTRLANKQSFKQLRGPPRWCEAVYDSPVSEKKAREQRMPARKELKGKVPTNSMYRNCGGGG